MRALVTGGAGFIGSHLATRLHHDGHDVLVLDSLDPRVHPRTARFPDGLPHVRADVRDTSALAAALRGVDVVFHEAGMVGLGMGASDAPEFLDANATATAKLLIALRDNAPNARLVLASTMALYGEGAYACDSCGPTRPAPRTRATLDAGEWDPACPRCARALTPRPVTEEHPPEPRTAYAISKRAQEEIALTLGAELGIPVVALRYHNVYGPGMPRGTPYAGVASFFKDNLLRGEPPLVHEDGRQLRDFVHVYDIVQANLLAARDGVPPGSYNVGTGDPRPILELAVALAREIAPDQRPRVPGTYRPGDARHVYASIEKARKHLGYEPRVRFEDAVASFARSPAREPSEPPA